MKTIFSTAGVPQAEAFAYWKDAAPRPSILRRPESIEAADRATFSGEIKAGKLAELPIFMWTAAPSNARYNRNGNDDFMLLLHARQSFCFEFSERSFVLPRGGLLLLSSRERWRSGSHTNIDMIGLGITRNMLERRIRSPIDKVTNQSIPVEVDTALLTGLLVKLIELGPSKFNPIVTATVREHVLDLTAVALSNLTGTVPKLGAYTQFLALKLRATIDTQLTNPYATRANIAAAVGISERHANRILAEDGTSIWKLLIERRLAKCAEALSNSHQQHRSISSIAMGFGFSDLTHFAHVFKRRFGVAPGEYRDKYKT